MNCVKEKLDKCLEIIKSKVDFKPEVALILGSGLGEYAEQVTIEQTISYNEIEGFPARQSFRAAFRLHSA